MNNEASRGNSSNKSWPLDVLFRSVLHFCEKEFMEESHKNLPPLIHKKMFMHTIYRVRVRLSRLYVIYKWCMKQNQIQHHKPEYKNSYFSRLQLSVDHLQNTYNYFHKLSFKSLSFNNNLNQIEFPNIAKKMIITSKEYFREITLQTKMHKSVTKTILIRDKLIIISQNKYQYTIKFKKTKIKLLNFQIFCSNKIDAEPVIKKITQNCIHILNNTLNPLYQCCEFLEKVYMFLYFTLICKTFQSYQKFHKFTIHQNSNGNVILNFYELQMKFSLVLLQSSIYIFSHDERANIKYPIEQVEEIPTILSKIQHFGSIFLFSRFKKYIDEWLMISKCFSTFIDETNCYFNLLFFNNPISKISLDSENKLHCDHPQFLTSLLTQNNKLFYEFIEMLEIRIIAESTGFLNLVLYNGLSFKKALNTIRNNDVLNKQLCSLGSTNTFLKNLYEGDLNTYLHFKQILSISTNSIIFQKLYKKLSRHNINSIVSNNCIIIETETYGFIKLKIDKNGYWSLKFSKSKLLNNANMDLMFQGHQISLQFNDLIDDLISSVITMVQIIDQTYFQLKTNGSVSIFNFLEKISFSFRGFCPSLKTISYLSPLFTLNLEPVKFVGCIYHYDVYEIGTCLPILNAHFVKCPVLDDCVLNAIEEDLIDQKFGSFIHFQLPTFPHFFEIFQGNDWTFLNVSFKATFGLMYQSKYMLYFRQQAKNCFLISIPPVGKSIILKIPLSIFPFINSSDTLKKTKVVSKTPQQIKITMTEMSILRDSILTFFNEQKFMKNFGYSLLLYNAKANVIMNSEAQTNGDLIRMKISLGANGLTFEVLEDLRRPCIYSFNMLLNMIFSNRTNRLKILNFLFECLQIEKPTALGFFESLQCLLDGESTNIDWENTLLNSTVDVQNCTIDFHLFINHKEYIILIDSSNESSDSEDALVSVTKPNGDFAPVKKLKNELMLWFSDLLNQESAENILLEFSFL